MENKSGNMKNIGNCLESLKRQTYPKEKIEIIVVDKYFWTDY